ncbi:MAG: MFS transporter [Spirochaetota bacterium]|nr:MFS transporter [Spirochaetota bacterium]
MKKGIINKEVFGWAMFDFANSSYTTIIITTIFSTYFVNVVVGENTGTFWWGLTLSISYLLVALSSPIVGAIADYSGSKKKFLFYFFLVCIIFTFLLFFVGKGDLYMGMLFVIVSNVGFAMGENLISSFLPEIASSKDIGMVSGFGWSFGYIGGILSLIGSLIILMNLDDKIFASRLTILFTAIFFAVSVVPTFVWLKDRSEKHRLNGMSEYFKVGYNRLINTFHHVKIFKDLMKLLLAYFFYFAGLTVIISFSAIFAESAYKFSKEELILLIIFVNTTASIGAFVFGFVQDKIGAKLTLIFTLILWIITISLIYFIDGKLWFWILANVAGIGLGSTQSATRAMVGLFSPKPKLAEFYGFWGFFGKLSSILGPITFGLLSNFNSSKYNLKSDLKFALLSALVFFIIGFVILFLVNEKEGIRQAQAYKD